MKKLLFIGLFSALSAACLQARAQDGRANARVSRSPAASAKLRIRFQPVVDGQALERGKTYTDPFGEAYTVDRLRFYIGQVQLFSGNTPPGPIDPTHSTDPGHPAHPGRLAHPDNGYFLFDSDDSTAAAFTLSLAPGRYDSLSFLLGVDSLYNVSGAQTGALDPQKGMFWTWRTGYVMAKLEGSSPLSHLPQHRIEYHIGGFEGIHKVIRTLHLGFPPGTPDLPGASLVLKEGSVTEVLITADCNAWFRGAHEIRIAATPSCSEPGILAREFSGNYAKMFQVRRVSP